MTPDVIDQTVPRERFLCSQRAVAGLLAEREMLVAVLRELLVAIGPMGAQCIALSGQPSLHIEVARARSLLAQWDRSSTTVSG